VEENLTLTFGEDKERIPLEREVVHLIGNVCFLLLFHFSWVQALADESLIFSPKPMYLQIWWHPR
jgi:hypothetical protein